MKMIAGGQAQKSAQQMAEQKAREAIEESVLLKQKEAKEREWRQTHTRQDSLRFVGFYPGAGECGAFSTRTWRQRRER